MSQRPTVAGPACWLDVELPTVAENLALDEALLLEASAAATPTTVVRTWMAPEPAVVLGSSSRVAEEVDLDACRAAGVAVLRRPSGGLSVVLGPGCLMWTVVTPCPAPTPTIAAIHDAVLDPLCAALRVPERASWKACVVAPEEETRQAAAFRESFAAFDFTLEL